MMARRSCTLGTTQSSLSNRMRPSGENSTSVASMVSMYNFIRRRHTDPPVTCVLKGVRGLDSGCGRGALGIRNANYHRDHWYPVDTAAVDIFEVHAGFGGDPHGPRQCTRLVRHGRVKHIALLDLIMLFAQRARGMQRV